MSRARRAEPLGVVVEVGQVDERQVGPLASRHVGRGAPGDPVGARQAGGRSPEGAERERAEVALEPVGQALGRAGDAEDLVAVGPVIGLGGDAEIDRRSLVEPPEELGRAEGPAPLGGPPTCRHVDRLGLDQGVRLLPEPDLAGLAEEPAVADDRRARRAGVPVRRLACAVQVTAGTTSRSDRHQPASASARSRGACASSRPVRPTALIRTKGLRLRARDTLVHQEGPCRV